MSSSIDLGRDTLLQSQDLTIIQNEFNKYPPSLNVFRVNLDVLKSSSQSVKFNDTAWEQNPEKFCIEYYNTPHLALIVLLVNNVTSRFSFTSTNLNGVILAPFTDDIYRILSFR